MRPLLSIALCLVSGCSLYFDGGNDVVMHESEAPDASVSRPDAFVSRPDATVGSLTYEGVCSNDCGEQVCGVYGTCVDASSVRDVSITWEEAAASRGAQCWDTTTVSFSFAQSAFPRMGTADCGTGAFVIKNVPKTLEVIYTVNPHHTYQQCSFVAAPHAIAVDGSVWFDSTYLDSYDDCPPPSTGDECS